MKQICADPYEEYTRLKKKLTSIETAMQYLQEELISHPSTDSENSLKDLEFEFCELIAEIVELEDLLDHHQYDDGFFIGSTK